MAIPSCTPRYSFQVYTALQSVILLMVDLVGINVHISSHLYLSTIPKCVTMCIVCHIILIKLHSNLLQHSSSFPLHVAHPHPWPNITGGLAASLDCARQSQAIIPTLG